jgi:hypothetical protein
VGRHHGGLGGIAGRSPVIPPPAIPPAELSNHQSQQHAIDTYFKSNSIAEWSKNYQHARELDYIRDDIALATNGIARAQQKLATVVTTATGNGQTVKAMKNQFNSDILNVHIPKFENTDKTRLMLYANRGCLSADERDILGVSTMCDAADTKQLYEKIQNTQPHAGIIYPAVYQLRSVKWPTQCVEFDSNGASIRPCDSSFNTKGQHFAPLYQSVSINPHH